jgi:hypothetical protein
VAKTTNKSANSWSPKPRKKRPGVHAKSKNARSKKSKNYRKAYRGQGRM